MLDRPALKSSFHAEVVEGEGVYLLSERGYFVLKGALYCRLAPLLDGRRAADEIVDALCDTADPAAVYYALARLEERGYVVEGSAACPERAAFWQSLGIDAALAERRLAEAVVSCRAFGAADAEPFVEALAEAGVRVGREAGFSVAVVDDYLADGLRAWSAALHASATPGMLVKPGGSVLWIGPVFRPGVTACWECLADALRRNRRTESYLQSRRGSEVPFPVSRGALRSSEGAALHLAAIETVKALAAPERLASDARLVTVDLASLDTQHHELVRRPQCPRCGTGPLAADRPAEPVVLRSRPKRFTLDGGHRTVAPEETLAAYGRHVSPLLGTVGRLERVAGGAMSVYVCGQGFAREPVDLSTLRHGLTPQSCGKGSTDAQARASALCEALERTSGVYRGDEPRRRGSLRGLGGAAIHPNDVMLFSARQYARRAEGPAAARRSQAVPAPFDPDAERDWTPVWSLTRGAARFLPTEYCFYGAPPAECGASCPADSNGCAAGNTLEEAVLQGFLELVERDAVALWWYARARRPAVDLDSFDEPRVAALARAYAESRRTLHVLDLTSDLGIPVVAAVSRRAGDGPEQILLGYGAHLEPRLALLRAVSELHQMVAADAPAAPPSDREGWTPERFRWEATFANEPYLVPAGGPARCARDWPRGFGDDLLEDVARCRAIVEERGLEMLVLDQTRPELGLPVVKVIVPGLRHFWPRFAPGRLYDVPVRLGWTAAPLAEHELNPIPLF